MKLHSNQRLLLLGGVCTNTLHPAAAQRGSRPHQGEQRGPAQRLVPQHRPPSEHAHWCRVADGQLPLNRPLRSQSGGLPQGCFHPAGVPESSRPLQAGCAAHCPPGFCPFPQQRDAALCPSSQSRDPPSWTCHSSCWGGRWGSNTTCPSPASSARSRRLPRAPRPAEHRGWALQNRLPQNATRGSQDPTQINPTQ